MYGEKTGSSFPFPSIPQKALPLEDREVVDYDNQFMLKLADGRGKGNQWLWWRRN